MSKNILHNRMELMFLLQARMCNPNGNPDAGNEPRSDSSAIGIITDVAIKRWIRNYIEDSYGDVPGFEIMMTNGANINKLIAKTVFEANGIENTKDLPTNKKNKKTNLKTKEAAAIAAERYWDVRTFGGVLSTGLNGGQIKGAVQVGISTSKDPVETMDLTITRMCYTDESNATTIDEYEEEETNKPSDEKRTMGEKQVVIYGLYEVHISISATIAEKVGFTEDDLDKLEEAILQMLDHNNSSSKMGMSLVTPLIIFKHVGTQGDTNSEQGAREAKLGCSPSHKLYHLLSARKKEGVESPISLKDYNISFDSKHIPNGVKVGMKYYPFEPVKWGENAFDEWEFNLKK